MRRLAADTALHPADILLTLEYILLEFADILLALKDILLAGIDTRVALADILLALKNILLAARDRAKIFANDWGQRTNAYFHRRTGRVAGLAHHFHPFTSNPHHDG